MEEKEGAEHIFHLIFFHMIEFLGVGCIWDKKRHIGRYNYSWCTQNPPVLLLEPLQYPQLCIRNTLQFEHFEFSQKQTWAKDLGANALLRKCLQENSARQ